MEHTVLIAVIAIAFGFAFFNGFHDGCNVIATIVSSRSMNPKTALAFACLAEFLGPLVLGTAVASTIGKDIIDPEIFHSSRRTAAGFLLLAGLAGAIVWNLITWRVGMPSSSSHALIGGLVGAGVAAFGKHIVSWENLVWNVMVVLLVTPVIGMVAGFVTMHISVFLFRNAHPRINNFFKRIQVFSMVFLGASHGANDAQKTMGIVTMMLVISGALETFEVPGWVVLGSAASLALGVSFGGWKIVRTVGMRIFRVAPIHSFNAQLAAGTVIFTAGLMGGPVSTTQIVGSTVVGVGAGYRWTDVRWIVVKDIMIAWLITIPLSAVLAAVFYWTAAAAFGLPACPW